MGKLNSPLQGSKRDSLLQLLQQAQRRFGYVPDEVITEVANSLNVTIGDVYGVATFYSFLRTRPAGRNIIRVCKSLPCYLKNSQNIVNTIQRELGIKPGGTTADGKFSLELTNCIGACDKAPAMLINDDLHGDLTPARIARILKSYK